MEIKVVLYILGAIGYFVYQHYKRLQSEALKRKAMLDSAKQNSEVETQSYLPDKQKQSLVKQSLVKQSLIKKQTILPVEGGYSHPSVFFNEQKSEKQIVSIHKTASDIDFRLMILYSEILKRPQY